MEIESKKHPYKFFLILILLNLFLISLSIFFFKSKEVNLNYFGLIFILLLIVFNYFFLKNSPKIIVDKYGIKFGKKKYLWEDSIEIKITGKGNGLIYSYYESTKISFKNQDVIYIYDEYYLNSSEIKSFINQIVINKKKVFKKQQLNYTPKNLYLESFSDFKGHPILSFRGIMMWSVIIFFAFLPFYSSNKIQLIPLLIVYSFCLIWFLLSSWMMHYFRISNKYFIVKNHYFFWTEKIYLLENIEEIVYEQQGKQSNALRIITTDFKSTRFLAGSLSDKKWLKMKAIFEEKNIKVRNECI